MSALVTESMQARLARLVPGAVCEPAPLTVPAPPQGESYRVVRAGRTLAVGATEREAIDRAIFLFGGRS